MPSLSDKLQQVRDRLQQAAASAGRAPESLTLLGVSKKQPASAVRELYAAGQRAFGENYLQEALDKQAVLTDLAIEWHFIGPIQSNKTRPVAEHFSWVHSVDRLKIARRLSEQRPQSLPPLNICLQINIDDEVSKSGVAPADLPALAREVAALERLRLRGLMAIPAPRDDYAGQVAVFERLQALNEDLRQAGLDVDTLSMGMSADLEAAVAAGATIVRVGTDLFGPRS